MLAGAVIAYTSTRSMLAGRLLSVFDDGTVNCRSTVAPLRSAENSAGAAGIFTSGGSGGPFLPHAGSRTTTINAQIAETAEKSTLCVRGELCVDRSRGRAPRATAPFTGYTATGLPSY